MYPFEADDDGTENTNSRFICQLIMGMTVSWMK
jgi:hypothetical protein